LRPWGNLPPTPSLGGSLLGKTDLAAFGKLNVILHHKAKRMSRQNNKYFIDSAKCNLKAVLWLEYAKS